MVARSAEWIHFRHSFDVVLELFVDVVLPFELRVFSIGWLYFDNDFLVGFDVSGKKYFSKAAFA